MIDLKKLRCSDKGRQVKYTSGHGTTEIGTLRSWNNKYVFVNFPGFSSNPAVLPEQLEFVTLPAKKEGPS